MVTVEGYKILASVIVAASWMDLLSKMGLTSLHYIYGSWLLYICRSLFGHSFFLVVSLLFMKGTSCCVIRKNFNLPAWSVPNIPPSDFVGFLCARLAQIKSTHFLCLLRVVLLYWSVGIQTKVYDPRKEGSIDWPTKWVNLHSLT